MQDLLGLQVGYTWALQGATVRGQQDFFCGFIAQICLPHQDSTLIPTDTQLEIFFPHDGESIRVSPVVARRASPSCN